MCTTKNLTNMLHIRLIPFGETYLRMQIVVYICISYYVLIWSGFMVHVQLALPWAWNCQWFFDWWSRNLAVSQPVCCFEECWTTPEVVVPECESETRSSWPCLGHQIVSGFWLFVTWFVFPIINFPHVSSNVPKQLLKTIFITQLFRLARLNSPLNLFSHRLKILLDKLIARRDNMLLLKKVFKSFCSNCNIIPFSDGSFPNKCNFPY